MQPLLDNGLWKVVKKRPMTDAHVQGRLPLG